MIEAVLFDWGETLVHFEWDDELVEAGHRAALGRDDPAFTGRWREFVLGAEHGHRPYAELLAELGVEDPDAFIDAEHEVWRPASSVLSSAAALLESLRDRGLKTGVVANAWPDPGRILRADAEALGLRAHLDVLAFGHDVLEACRELGADPGSVLFVGDALADLQRAADVGMTTVQALWFRADDAEGVEPDFQAFTAMDVLNVARRLARSPR